MKPTFDQSKIAAYCRSNGIRRLELFGSAVRADFTEDSDLDLLVEFQPGTRVGLSFFRIEGELSDLFGRKVDLNTPSSLNRHFRDRVLRETQTLYDAA